MTIRPHDSEVCDDRQRHPLLPLFAKDVRLQIGDRSILRDLSFRVDSVGLTVILGPNGAGKSMLLRLCHGLVEPSGGEIRWGDRTVRSVRREQAMVLQRTALLRRSVTDNLVHVLRVNGIQRSQRPALIEEALAQAGLTKHATHPARTLSGGQQKRLAIARACLLRPAVLFLDEPAANLDPAALRGVEALIRRVAEAGTKIFMTTHDIAQARRLAGDVMFLNDGRLLEHAAAAEFFAAPRTEAATRFLGGELVGPEPGGRAARDDE